MHDDLLAAIRAAVHDIAIAMLDSEPTPGVPKSKPADGRYQPMAMEVAAVVMLSGGINGGVRLAGSKGATLALAASFMGTPFTDLDSEARDAFGELANMITGGVQTHMADQCGEINLTPPRVVVPALAESGYNPDSDAVVHGFAMKGEPFVVEVFFLM